MGDFSEKTVYKDQPWQKEVAIFLFCGLEVKYHSCNSPVSPGKFSCPWERKPYVVKQKNRSLKFLKPLGFHPPALSAYTEILLHGRLYTV